MQCYCAAARRVARRLTRMYEAEMRAAGMNPAQFELMQHLQARTGISQAELADAMDLDQTTLSRNVRVLVGQGWVQIAAGTKDKRVSTYKLTRAGISALQKAVPLWKEARAKVQRAVRSDDAVWRVLGELAEAAQL